VTPPAAPFFDHLRHALAQREAKDAPRRPETREAGVVVALRVTSELEVLLIERVEREGDPWSGHIALPGGMREKADPDLLATALRETEEEVGLALDRERALLGRLDELAPSSRELPPLVISPFVATVAADAEITVDPREVAGALWAPLSELTDPAARSHVDYRYRGQDLRFPAIAYRGHRIWGLTYRILLQLLAVARYPG
jgi:8-oxo-dGTP pyrophosphatase MutT (NUDIX family)